MFPRLKTCSVNDFILSLESELCNLPALDPYGPVQTDDIDIHISDLIKLLSSCEIGSRLPSHSSLAKSRMPWWLVGWLVGVNDVSQAAAYLRR